MWATHLAAAVGLLLPAMIAAAPSAATPAAADPCGYLSATRVVPCFTDPSASDEVSSRIFQSIGALVDAAEPGDTIRILTYDWRDAGRGTTLAQRVVDAHSEGVDVRIILDERADDSIDARFRDAGIPVVTCDDWDSSNEAPGNRPENCLMWDDPGYYGPDSTLPMTHTKLWLFTIDGVRHVVAGSSNLGPWDYQNAWNDMVRIRDDVRLHTYLSEWWERTWADDWQGWGDTERKGAGDPATGPLDLPAMAYVYPRKSASADPIAANLAKVSDCSSDGDGDGDWDKRVYIAISKWNNGQRLDILDNLVRLDRAGCRVRVMVDWGMDAGWVGTLRSRLSGSSQNTTQVRWECRLHHKLMVLDAKYAGDWHELVVTGSDVWAKGSLLNSNELNLRIGGEDQQTDDGAVRRYIEHYSRIWDDFASTDVAKPTSCSH